MTNKYLLATAAALGVVASSQLARAACDVPAQVTAGYGAAGAFNAKPNMPTLAQSADSHYGGVICNQGFANDMVWAYDMDKGNWDDGRGWEEFCNLTRMLGRSLTALWVLNFSASNGLTRWDDLRGSVLQWAGNYAHLAFDELDGECEWDSSATARTIWGPLIDNYTDLYHGFHYEQAVITRAGVLLHEARHADWVGHDGNDGGTRCRGGGSSCDETFFTNTGKSGQGSSTGNYQGGANTYEVNFLHWFYNSGVNSTQAIKNMGRDRGNWVLNNRFDSRPTFRI